MRFSIHELPRAKEDKRQILLWLLERSRQGAAAWLSACDDALLRLEQDADSYGQPMSENNGSQPPSDFPATETFVDFAGNIRTFNLEQYPVPGGGYGVAAIEDVEGDDGYRFRAFSVVDPFHALGDLRQRIRKLLSIRHLHKRDGRLSFTHDRLRGHVSYGGVVVDGIFLTFEQLAELVQTYEGFQFDLKIIDSSDELE